MHEHLLCIKFAGRLEQNTVWSELGQGETITLNDCFIKNLAAPPPSKDEEEKEWEIERLLGKRISGQVPIGAWPPVYLQPGAFSAALQHKNHGEILNSAIMLFMPRHISVVTFTWAQRCFKKGVRHTKKIFSHSLS